MITRSNRVSSIARVKAARSSRRSRWRWATAAHGRSAVPELVAVFVEVAALTAAAVELGRGERRRRRQRSRPSGAAPRAHASGDVLSVIWSRSRSTRRTATTTAPTCAALTDTLICDEDGLYDPADFNDRMLLGLKGTLSEAELHFIRARLCGGQLSKGR